jgi:hypothetical protein
MRRDARSPVHICPVLLPALRTGCLGDEANLDAAAVDVRWRVTGNRRRSPTACRITCASSASTCQAKSSAVRAYRVFDGGDASRVDALRAKMTQRVRSTSALCQWRQKYFCTGRCSSGLKGHPSYGNEVELWNAVQLSGAYYPIQTRIQNRIVLA